MSVLARHPQMNKAENYVCEGKLFSFTLGQFSLYYLPVTVVSHSQKQKTTLSQPRICNFTPMYDSIENELEKMGGRMTVTVSWMIFWGSVYIFCFVTNSAAFI